MRTYILDLPCKSRSQIYRWLIEKEPEHIVRIFDDYYEFMKQTMILPPDNCFIRLGKNEIPGLKAAVMVLKIRSDIRIVLLSDNKEYVMDAYEIGAYGYLLCPINRTKFDEFLKR